LGIVEALVNIGKIYMQVQHDLLSAYSVEVSI
jgi:hypothetical protein